MVYSGVYGNADSAAVGEITPRSSVVSGRCTLRSYRWR